MLNKHCFTFLFLFVAVPLSAETITLSTLLDEMIDRDALTRFPEPAYVCVQASSYDRASTSPNEPGWFANRDTAQFIREETNGTRREWVLMDAEGPGVIVRWWITAPHYRTTVRIYLDGNDTPTIEVPIAELIGGDLFVGEPLSAVRARGRNFYLPIPYAKHCKVTVDNMPEQGNLYYQINYRKYAEGTKVESFTMDNFKLFRESLDYFNLSITLNRNRSFLNIDSADPRAPKPTVIPRGGRPVSIIQVPAADSTRRPLLNRRNAVGSPPSTARALESLSVKVDAQNEEQLARALRSTVLSISFDGKETVWCPLGDFFGSGVGINPYISWYTGVHNGTLESVWLMPFQRTMDVRLINYGTENVAVWVSGKTTEYNWTDRSMYFHANWRQERNIETFADRGTKDWNYIQLKGRGVFVGDVLSLVNYDPAWWGEGDEKIYVDGEGTPVPEGGKGVLPSHFGTGTEDYYGYAWNTWDFFESPFHFQPRVEGPRNYGNTTNGRVRLLDGIPFTQDFRFDMEIFHWVATKVDYSVVTFWYGFDGVEPVNFPTLEERIAEVQSPVFTITPMSQQLRGFNITKFPTGGNLRIQDMRDFTRENRRWENTDHLLWRDAQPNAKLELILETNQDGLHKLVGELTKARDYGIVLFRVNGVNVGEPIDLYHPEVIPTGPIGIGIVELKAGKHIVEVEIVGRNEHAEPAYMVGIDLLRLVAVP